MSVVKCQAREYPRSKPGQHLSPLVGRFSMDYQIQQQRPGRGTWRIVTRPAPRSAIGGAFRESRPETWVGCRPSPQEARIGCTAAGPYTGRIPDLG
jgi:hypothetical protein